MTMAEFQQASWAGERYVPPRNITTVALADILAMSGRATLADRQYDLLRSRSDAREVSIFAAGDLRLLQSSCVSVVGTREVSEGGALRTRRFARELADAGVVVVSGLAKGVDGVAHRSAIASGGRTVAVIGTPLDKAYPAENAELQRCIYEEHLLISPFASGERTFRANFPKRNRVMAAISDATVIMEASDSSGTLHQAAECLRLGRWLFIARSAVDDPNLSWPRKFLGHDKVAALRTTSDVLDVIRK